MANNKFNLDGIKQEMEARRTERNSVSEQLGESIANNGQTKDGFLDGLLTSFKTGKETHSTKRIKLIENKVDIKEGKAPKFKENHEELAEINNRVAPKDNIMLPDGDRDELMYAKLGEKARGGGQSLSESLMDISGSNKKSNLSNQQNQPTALTEGVKNVVNNYLAENFGLIVEESIKNTILEMYAVDRIKQVLFENKALIKGVVLEILRDMKAKQKV